MPAEYLEESFEGTGYENSWSVTEGSGCTIDEDNTDVARPTGGGEQVLKMIGAGNGVANQIQYTLADNKSDTWTSLYFRLNALTDLASIPLLHVLDSAWTDAYRVNAKRDGSTYTLEISVYYNGTFNTEIDSKVVSLDTWYRIDVKYDRTGTAWEWRVDGASEGSGSLPGTLALGAQKIQLKNYAYVDGFACTAYWDRIWIDDSEYGYGEGGETTLRLIWTK